MNGHGEEATPHPQGSKQTTHDMDSPEIDDEDDIYGLKHPVAHPRVNGVEVTVNGSGVHHTTEHASLEESEEDDDDQDEINSLFEDALEELGDETLLQANGKFCPSFPIPLHQ
jgi:hypothetical protein